LEILVRNAPKDVELNRELAMACAAAGQAERAEKIYADLIRMRPTDAKLTEELKNLSARKTLNEGGYETANSFRDVLKDKAGAVALEQENRQVKSEDVAMRLVNEYEARLVNEPNNVKLLRSLAELYATKKDFEKSLETYNKIVKNEGAADASLQKAIAVTVTKKFEFIMGQLDPQAPDYQDRVAQIKAERDAYLLEECKQRAEKYPSDLQIRFELGQLYFNAGKISEAIQEFQKALANPHRRLQTLGYLGQCFARRGMNDLAARTLQSALKEKLIFDEEKKELIYQLGCIFEKMSKKEEAIEQFKQIYEVDIGFKDVAAKVDAYYGGQ